MDGFSSERLVYIPLKEEHAKEIYKLWSNPRVIKYMVCTLKRDIDGCKKWIRRMLADVREPNVFAIKYNQNIIGLGGVPCWNKKSNKYSMHYQILEQYWNRGFGIEIANALGRYAFAKCGANVIGTYVVTKNKSSINVLKKLGMNLVDTRIGIFKKNNKIYDEYYYKITKKQWEDKNSDKIIIRKAVNKDGESLINYINKVGGESDFLTFGFNEYGRTVKEEETFIENTLKKDNAYFIVAEDNGKIVGNLNFSGGLRERNAHVGEFGVSVLKEYWGQGIGEKLINSLIKWSEESKIIRKINLRVREDNYGAIKLYEKLGFIKEGIITREFCVNGEFFGSILMGLNID